MPLPGVMVDNDGQGSHVDHPNANPVRVSSPQEIAAFFRGLGKHVVSFAGFGELGYEEKGVVPRIAREVLAPWPPGRVIVCCGTLLRVGGESGIAAVYEVARALGMETAGIHPSVALGFAETHRLSPFCDRAHWVHDDTWGVTRD